MRPYYCIGAISVLLACGPASRGPDTKTPDQKAIVTSATNDYIYDPPKAEEAASVPASAIDNDGVTSASPLGMTIARARLKNPTSPDANSQVLAMIHSDVSYPPLHIPAGDSYLWRDKFNPAKADKSWNLYIVPKDLSNPDVKLWKRWKGEIEYSHLHADSSEPHLVYVTKSTPGAGTKSLNFAYGACIEDQVCPAQHCGYSEVK